MFPANQFMLSCKTREQMHDRRNLSRKFESVKGHSFVQDRGYYKQERGNFTPISLLSPLATFSKLFSLEGCWLLVESVNSYH